MPVFPRRFVVLLAGLLVGLLWLLRAHAGPAPSAISPGGALPQVRPLAEPFVYPEVETPAETPAPVVDDKDAPRMLLRGFDLRGVRAHPEQGISVQAVRELISKETARMIPAGQPRLFSMAMFEQLTDAITRFYRSRGFFLARAYIPEQKVKNGIVRLEVVETFLDQVIPDNNTLYSDAQLTDLFADKTGEPVLQTDIEDALFRLNDYPGLRASAIFGPGARPGSAAMVLRVAETPSFDMVSLDNYGSAYTGEYRIMYRHQSNNLLGQADRLTFNAMTTFSPANNQYVDVHYSQPVWRSRLKLGGGAIVNLFKVGQELEDLNINGQSLIVNGFADYPVLHTRNHRLSLVGDLSLKSATSKIVDTTAAKDKLTVLRLDLFYTGIDRWLWPASHDLTLSVSKGFAGVLGAMDSNGDGLSGRRGGSGARAGGDFLKFNLRYHRLQPTFDLQALQLRLDWQASSDLLTSLEQYSLGGPYSVRAYPTAEVLVDNALFASLEYILTISPDIRQTWLNRLQLSAFFDYAQGDLNDPLVNEDGSASLSGIGLAVQVEPFNLFRARLDFARATGDKPSDLQTLPFYFSLEYRF